MARAAFRMEPHYYSNPVTSPSEKSLESLESPESRKIPRLSGLYGLRTLWTFYSRDSGEKRKSAFAIDLSGDPQGSQLWCAKHLASYEVHLAGKAEFKWRSKLDALKLARSFRPEVFAVYSSDLSTQSAARAMMLFGALTGAKTILMGDGAGRMIARSQSRALMVEAPLLALEFAFGYALLVPLSWLLTVLLGASLSLGNLSRRMHHHSTREREREGRSALYIKANPATLSTGGQASHVAGFQSGALACGHRLAFIAASDAGLDCNRSVATILAPASGLSATRALFELWNNLLFTAASLEQVKSSASEFDFIYQRYNRFNWAGAALSFATGLPLALEFNGSEVWVSRNWDPVGLVWLLGAFESLNLKAADSIFVVSEVERNNLLRAGVDAEKIVVNPNGVDTEKFHPRCGGGEVRRALGLEEKIVIGFVGTFGPWHGAPVLAEAATIAQNNRCHFLFIGDGDERSKCEAIMEEAGRRDRATFAGRLPHDLMPAYLDACDILVSPHVPSKDGSEFFGSPTKLFEYLAMARPVVASRLGQIADVIVDGENGLLVEPGDARGLARAIEQLAEDCHLRARLSERARQTVVERYTWERNAARVFDRMEEKL